VTSGIDVAAIAHRHEVAVLHYDRDYDLIKSKTNLDFESVWLARRGTLSSDRSA